MKHEISQLNYSYDALEPYIDAQTMEIHHTKHHQNYVNKLNEALDKHPELFDKSIKELLSNINNLPEDIRTAVKNNGGGHFNHSIFWGCMSPNSKKAPEGKLIEKINETFGSFENFKELFTKTATTHFGSGWTWLVLDKNNELKVYSTQNQDTPLEKGDIPLICIDLWEHAYYLKYQNRRPEYIENWWNIVNWDFAEEKLA